jgi:hypothetical protein
MRPRIPSKLLVSVLGFEHRDIASQIFLLKTLGSAISSGKLLSKNISIGLESTHIPPHLKEISGLVAAAAVKKPSVLGMIMEKNDAIIPQDKRDEMHMTVLNSAAIHTVQGFTRSHGIKCHQLDSMEITKRIDEEAKHTRSLSERDLMLDKYDYERVDAMLENTTKLVDEETKWFLAFVGQSHVPLLTFQYRKFFGDKCDVKVLPQLFCSQQLAEEIRLPQEEVMDILHKSVTDAIYRRMVMDPDRSRTTSVINIARNLEYVEVLTSGDVIRAKDDKFIRATAQALEYVTSPSSAPSSPKAADKSKPHTHE